jgi:hypothetical protein
MKSMWGPDCAGFQPERWLRDDKFVVSPYRQYLVFQASVCVI